MKMLDIQAAVQDAEQWTKLRDGWQVWGYLC